MASQVEWANRALDKIGEQPLIDLNDNSKAGRTVKRMYDIVRDAELRTRRWSFSIKRTLLSPDVAVPAYGYGAQFSLPEDFLRLLSIYTFDFGPNQSDYLSSNTQTYVIEGRKILYGRPIPSGPPITEPMPLRYIARIPDTTLWDPSFGEAFACRLAAELCEPLTQSADKRRLAWQEYQQAVALAVRANAVELPPDSISDDTWVFGRLRG